VIRRANGADGNRPSTIAARASPKPATGLFPNSCTSCPSNTRCPRTPHPRAISPGVRSQFPMFFNQQTGVASISRSPRVGGVAR
jgi:hypothetical protein